MTRKTVLYDEHVALAARMVDFAGWNMPLHYGSQIQEHQAVRQYAGVFDVSHMTIVDITGETVTEFLRFLLANDVAKLNIGKALYSCMLTESGGVIDDLIVYAISATQYRLILNASTTVKDLAWIHEHAKQYEVAIEHREDLAIIALQGPQAVEIAAAVFDGEFMTTVGNLKAFQFVKNEKLMIARTGYTGEDGFEIIISSPYAVNLWQQIIGASAKPCGLGARDTLRLEAGFHLYGQEMDENTSPLAAHLAWTVSFTDDRDFIGKSALLQQLEQGVPRQLKGLVLESGGILRHGQAVYSEGEVIGQITSGGFSPTLDCSIALASLNNQEFTSCKVELRGKMHDVRVVAPAFVRKGKALVVW